MKLGVLFPQTEFGADPIAIREYAQAAEDLGYESLALYEHVVSARPEGRAAEWMSPYHRHMFHEPFVLFGYLAGVTRRLVFVTKALGLPQRQTALVAKQAAEVDVITGGRIRLGVGVGWNSVDFEAMGQDFHTRGRRIEEQITVLRLLWTQEFVTFVGRYHRISDAGLNPMPIQRPIPIWIAGESEPVVARVARLADGWFPGSGVMTPFRLHPPRSEEWGRTIERMRTLAREAGRDPQTIGIEGGVSIGGKTPEEWTKAAERWREFGATHFRVNTMEAGLTSPTAHIGAIRRFWDVVAPVVRAPSRPEDPSNPSGVTPNEPHS